MLCKAVTARRDGGDGGEGQAGQARTMPAQLDVFGILDAETPKIAEDTHRPAPGPFTQTAEHTAVAIDVN